MAIPTDERADGEIEAVLKRASELDLDGIARLMEQRNLLTLSGVRTPDALARANERAFALFGQPAAGLIAQALSERAHAATGRLVHKIEELVMSETSLALLAALTRDRLSPDDARQLDCVFSTAMAPGPDPDEAFTDRWRCLLGQDASQGSSDEQGGGGDWIASRDDSEEVSPP